MNLFAVPFNWFTKPVGTRSNFFKPPWLVKHSNQAPTCRIRRKKGYTHCYLLPKLRSRPSVDDPEKYNVCLKLFHIFVLVIKWQTLNKNKILLFLFDLVHTWRFVLGSLANLCPLRSKSCTRLLSWGMAITPALDTASLLAAQSPRIVASGDRMFLSSQTFTLLSSDPDTILSSLVNTADVTVL